MADAERPDPDERADDGDHPVPDDPQANPEQAVDAVEQRVLGRPTGTAPDDEPADTTPAFEQDLDPADQGSAGAAEEQPG
jgi:hypothetical protein